MQIFFQKVEIARKCFHCEGEQIFSIGKSRIGHDMKSVLIMILEHVFHGPYFYFNLDNVPSIT